MKSGCASSQQNMMTIMMKMAVVSTITVLLLCCSVFASKDPQKECDSFAATSESFTVPLNFKLEGKHRLKWKRNNEVIFDRIKLEVLDGKEDDVTGDGSLKLKKVGKTAEGTYTPEVYDTGKAVENLKSTKLCVIDRVGKPTVKIECGSSSVKFICNVSPSGKNVNIEWLQNGKVLNKYKDQTFIPMISKNVETDMFSCKVSNQVSNWTSPSVKQNCTKSGFVFPETFLGINTWIFVGIGGGVVLLLIIAVIVCCIRNRRRKRIQLKNEEEFRLGFANNQPQHNHQHNHPPNQHQHHHHHHHHQQQPAGHTGPRQHRSRQQRNQQQIGAPDQPGGQPQPSPRRSAQGPRPAEKYHDEQPPPLPQPRKKAPKTQRV